MRRTPGPWQARFLYRMIRRVRDSPGDLLIASDPANDWGDAELMAAVPDLLECLRDILPLAEMEVRSAHHGDERYVRLARAREKVARARAMVDRLDGEPPTLATA